MLLSKYRERLNLYSEGIHATVKAAAAGAPRLRSLHNNFEQRIRMLFLI